MRANGIRFGVRFLALGYLGALLIAPLVLIFRGHVRHGLTPVWNSLSQADAVHAAKLSLYAMLIAVIAEHGVRRCDRAVLAPQGRHRNGARGLPRPPARALAGRRRPRAPARVTPTRAGSGRGLRRTASRCVRVPGDRDRDGLRVVPFVARELIPVLREIGDERSRPRRRSARAPADVLAHHAARDPARADLRHRADGRARSGRVRSGRRRLRRHPGPDRDADDDRRSATSNNFDQTGAYATSLLLAAIAVVDARRPQPREAGA